MHVVANRMVYPLVVGLVSLIGAAMVSPARSTPPPPPASAPPPPPQADNQSNNNQQASNPGGNQVKPGSAITPPPPGTEDDPSGGGAGGGSGNVGNPVYTDLPASMMLNVDLAPIEGKPVPEQLLSRFIERHSAMDYAAAAELALQLVDAAPDRPIPHYNLACVMAKLNRPEAALAALRRSVDCGWRSLSHISLDPDLASLHDTPEFAAILQRIKAKIAEEAITPAPLRTDELEAIVDDLNARVPVLLDRYHVPGVTVALVRDGQMVWRSSFGVRDRPGASDAAALGESDIFRVRAPMQVLALIAGAQLQNVGRMQLAEILRQGAELDRTDFAHRSGVEREDVGNPPSVGMTSVTPVSSHDRKPSNKDAAQGPNARLNVRDGSAAYGFLSLAIEMTSEQGFTQYCAEHVLGPFNMVSTRFLGPRLDEVNLLAIGHTPLGTAVAREHCPGEDRAIGGCLYTTAQDMGRLIESMLTFDSQSHTPVGNAGASRLDPIESLCKAAADSPGGTITMAVRVDNAKSAGRRVKVIDRTDGQGCLLCWYPSNRSGIAIMFNSATGAEAAERIAHIALGGD